VRWSGNLVVPEDGEYELGVEGDDGFRLSVDGKLAVDDWNTGPKRYVATKVALKKGQQVALDLEYFQATGDRNVRLVWHTSSERASLERSPSKPDATIATYLRAGTDWYDFWTHERYAGGQSVTCYVPLDVFRCTCAPAPSCRWARTSRTRPSDRRRRTRSASIPAPTASSPSTRTTTKHTTTKKAAMPRTS